MSETLFLKNVYTNEVIAILKHVDLKSPLQNLHLRVSSEITLLSNDAFEFIIAGTAIKKKQEQKYKVGVCAIRSADGKLYLDLTCRNPMATAVSIVADTVDTLTDQQGKNSFLTKSKPCNRPVKNSDDRELSGEHKYDRTSKGTGTQHTYPNFYSAKDIEETTETLEKERKIFSNSKLHQIIEEGSLHDWGIQAIQGVIDVHWVLRKNDLLKNCVKELNTTRSTHLEKDTTLQEEVNLLKNLDELEKATFFVDAEYARISTKLVSENKNRKELEKSFDETFTKLKVTQSNLIKSIDHYKGVHFKQETSSGITDIRANTSTESNEDVELSDNEMNLLVSSVKDDFLDNL